MTNKATSAEDVAEKLNCDLWGIPNEPWTDRELKVIVKTLTSYAEAMVQEALINYRRELVDIAFKDEAGSLKILTDKAVKEARNAAIEECAKIADEHSVAHRDYEYGTDDMIACELPKRIRQLKAGFK